jgi:hypothetical protein
MRAESGRAALEIVRVLKVGKSAVALYQFDERMLCLSGVEFLEPAITLYPDVISPNLDGTEQRTLTAFTNSINVRRAPRRTVGR